VETELQQWQPEQQQQEQQQPRSRFPQMADYPNTTRPPTVEDVFYAYYDCRKEKRNSWSALKFEERLERNLMQLHRELQDQTWEPSRLSCFVVIHPRPREIWASDFRDRIVQCVFYNRWRERYHNSFIYDTYACIPGRGALHGANRIARMMRQASKNYTTNAFVLKADIANFFVSIDKTVLEQILLKTITTEWDRWIVEKILWTDIRSNALIKSKRSLLKLVPAHKSLFNAPQREGLPIGNLTSQFFANIYLNELDQYAKHHLKLRYYGRYVDDIVLFGESGQELSSKLTQLDAFAHEHLRLTFHPNKTYVNKVQHGVNFVGYIILPHRRYLRRSILSNLMQKLEDPIFMADADVPASVNSYLGMLRHVNGYKARRKVCQRLLWLGYESDPKLTKLLT
jgi:RNA-directed DNA polymerase